MATDHSPREHLRYLSMLRSYLFGAIAVVLTTFIAWHFRSFLGSASILLLYTLQVFLVAYSFGLGPSILSVIYSVSAFAFFFAPPIFSFAVNDPHTFLALLVLLIVAIVTSSLMQRLRDQIALTQRNASRTEALLDLTEVFSEKIQEGSLALRLSEFLSRRLAVEATLWLLDEPIHSDSCEADFPLLNLPDQWHPESLKALFKNSATGLPGIMDPEGGRYLLLKAEARILGVLRLNPENDGYDLAPDQEAFLEDFVDQIAQQVDRLKLRQEAQKQSFEMEAESLRNALLSAISHDLKTPLTRIMSAATVISDQGSSLSQSSLNEFSGVLKYEVEHMVALMNKILDMARLTAGDIVPHPEWNHLEEIVGASLRRLEPELSDRTLTIDMSEDLPLVKLDALLIQQVIINLIENALKYTPASSPIVIRGTTAPDRIVLSVRDYGPGIPDAAIEQIFRKFSRLNPEGTQTGVGLGLSLSRSIVELHGGDLSYTSMPDGGACFTLALPRAGSVSIPSDEVAS